MNTGQIFLIQYADPNDEDDNSNTYLSVHQTEGSGDALNSTEVVITDLGDLGDDAIVVLEEAVGIGAEETVTGGSGLVTLAAHDEDSNTATSANNVFETNDLQYFSSMKMQQPPDSPEGLMMSSSDLGVHYETVETSSLNADGTETVIFRVNLDEDNLDTLDVDSRGGVGSPDSCCILDPIDYKDPLHLVKTKSKRRVVSRDDSLSSMYLCKLCNSYVDKSLMKQHNRTVHQDRDTLTCSDCGKLFTSKRSLFGHKKEKHSGHTEVFTCPDCNKQFSRKSNLKAHRESLHFGKKFPCRVCGRIFTNRSSMNQHVKKSHFSTEMVELEVGSSSGSSSSSADNTTTSHHISDLMNITRSSMDLSNTTTTSTSSMDLSLLEDSVDPLETVNQ